MLLDLRSVAKRYVRVQAMNCLIGQRVDSILNRSGCLSLLCGVCFVQMLRNICRIEQSIIVCINPSLLRSIEIMGGLVNKVRGARRNNDHRGGKQKWVMTIPIHKDDGIVSG